MAHNELRELQFYCENVSGLLRNYSRYPLGNRDAEFYRLELYYLECLLEQQQESPLPAVPQRVRTLIQTLHQYHRQPPELFVDLSRKDLDPEYLWLREWVSRAVWDFKGQSLTAKQ